jgi:rhodanese-related sulfurtransferase
MELRLMTQLKNQTPHAFAKACRQALFITIAAAALGLIVNALRPQGLDLIRSSETAVPVADSANSDGPQPIKLTAALEKLKKGTAVFMDARSEYDYKAGHIQTARNFPEKTLDIWMPDFFNTTPPEALLIIYCSDPRCHLAEHLAVRLYELGYPNIRFLTAGWDGWLAAGYPVESDPAFNSGQSLNQTTDCSSGECSDEQTSPTETSQIE